jgi:hypothetical protein
VEVKQRFDPARIIDRWEAIIRQAVERKKT